MGRTEDSESIKGIPGFNGVLQEVCEGIWKNS